jgi:hypothetical protein
VSSRAKKGGNDDVKPSSGPVENASTTGTDASAAMDVSTELVFDVTVNLPTTEWHHEGMLTFHKVPSNATVFPHLPNPSVRLSQNHTFSPDP